MAKTQKLAYIFMHICLPLESLLFSPMSTVSGPLLFLNSLNVTFYFLEIVGASCVKSVQR